ncbi:transposase [Thioclava sp. A2]|nr:transposase [Thioclava sp. A2]MDV7272340.1 transposase [Thioclava sp. A2]
MTATRPREPANGQAERIAREGIDLSLSTLADLIGHACVALAPIHALIERYMLAAGRLHGDDRTVPLLARGGTKTALLWTYVRDDRPRDGVRRLRSCSSSPERTSDTASGRMAGCAAIGRLWRLQ